MDDLLVFYRQGSTADILQARVDRGWGAVWAFAPCDAHAAEKAAWMMLRIHQGIRPSVRHARRARLHDQHRQAIADVIVVTVLPDRAQEVIEIENGIVLRVAAFLEDDTLSALEAALTPTPRLNSHGCGISLARTSRTALSKVESKAAFQKAAGLDRAGEVKAAGEKALSEG